MPVTLTIVRWIARVLALLLALMLLAFVVGEGLDPAALTAEEALLFIPFTVASLGLLIGWRWEVLGGALNVGGIVLFYVLETAFSGDSPEGPWFAMLAVPGTLYLVCWAVTRSVATEPGPSM